MVVVLLVGRRHRDNLDGGETSPSSRDDLSQTALRSFQQSRFHRDQKPRCGTSGNRRRLAAAIRWQDKCGRPGSHVWIKDGTLMTFGEKLRKWLDKTGLMEPHQRYSGAL